MVERLRERIVLPLGIFGLIIYTLFRITELDAYKDWDIAVYLSMVFIGGWYLQEYTLEEGLAGTMIAGAIVGFMWFGLTMFTEFFPGEGNISFLKYDILVSSVLLIFRGLLIETEEIIEKREFK